jgi:hypothetical protein
MSRITITVRHNGHFYIGPDEDAFVALAGAVGMGHKWRFGLPVETRLQLERIQKSLDRFFLKHRSPPSNV